MTRRIFIMRHADVENPHQLVYGSTPGFKLSVKGRGQVTEAKDFMRDIPLDLIATSPLERCRETAEIIAEGRSCQLVEEIRLKENSLGKEIEGVMSKEDFYAQKEKHLAAQHAGEGGMETPSAISTRMNEVFHEYVEQSPEKSMMFVSHGIPICLLLQSLSGLTPNLSAMELYPPKGSIFEVSLDSGVKVTKIFEPSA